MFSYRAHENKLKIYYLRQWESNWAKQKKIYYKYIRSIESSLTTMVYEIEILTWNIISIFQLRNRWNDEIRENKVEISQFICVLFDGFSSSSICHITFRVFVTKSKVKAILLSMRNSIRNSEQSHYQWHFFSNKMFFFRQKKHCFLQT